MIWAGDPGEPEGLRGVHGLSSISETLGLLISPVLGLRRYIDNDLLVILHFSEEVVLL